MINELWAIFLALCFVDAHKDLYNKWLENFSNKGDSKK